MLQSWCAQLAPEEAQSTKTWPPHNAAVSAEFPWHAPTNEVYKAVADDPSHADTDPPFHPPFAAARKRLDYKYHCNPMLSRQILQDKILLQVSVSTL